MTIDDIHDDLGAGTATPVAPGARRKRAAEDAAFTAPLPRTKPRRKPKAAKPAKPAAPQGEGAILTKKDLFARVKARAEGVKGTDLRAAMDAVLSEVGAALVAGESLKVPALGTLKVQRRKELPAADLAVLKLRRKKPGARPKDPLAKPEEGR